MKRGFNIMKGAVPVAYIVALLLGIAVVGLLGYWFFVLGGRAGGELTSQECNIKKTSACEQWKNSGQPLNMPTTRIYCKFQKPAACCTGKPDGWTDVTNPLLATWWKCTAPGCSENYGMEITKAQCGIP